MTQEELISIKDALVEIPEDIENLSEYIDNDMDNQPDEPILDQYMECIANKEPDVMPSCNPYTTWVASKFRSDSLYEEFKLLPEPEEQIVINGYVYNLDYQSDLDRYHKFIFEKFDNQENRELYESMYIKEYRKELREWYMKRKNIKLTNNGTKDTSTEGSGSN